MAVTITFAAVAAFLSGAVIGVLAILAAGIRSGEHARSLTSGLRTGTEAVIRRLLGVAVRTGGADHGEERER